MNLTTIKNVVMAAIFLPSLFMLIGSVAVVRTSYLEYLALDEDKHYADLLSQAGSIAASALPPQARGDAACLTLLMAQSFAAALPAGRASYVPLEDTSPIFSIRA